MARKKYVNTKSITAKIIAVNKRISDNTLNVSAKRAGEKEIRDLKRVIGKKTNEFFPSEIERLKTERKYLSQKKSRLNAKLKSGKAAGAREIKKTELEILRTAKRQMQVSKYIDPEKYDRRRTENKQKEIVTPKGPRDRTEWLPDIAYIPIYQVKVELLDKYATSPIVKQLMLNDKWFKKTHWAEMYVEWQSFYRQILNSATDLRNGKLKDSNIHFSSFRNRNGSKVKIVFDGFQSHS